MKKIKRKEKKEKAIHRVALRKRGGAQRIIQILRARTKSKKTDIEKL